MIPVPCQTHRNLGKCSKKAQMVLGILLIITAVITLIFGVVSVALPTLNYGYYGNAMWTSAVILPAGILCVCASKTFNRCVEISGLVMNIISIVFAVDQISWMSVAASNEEQSNYDCLHFDSYFDYYGDCTAEIAIDSVLIALGVVEFGLTIAIVCVLSVDVCCPGTKKIDNQPLIVVDRHPTMLNNGQPLAQGYLPQTHILSQPDQMYLHQAPGLLQNSASQLQPIGAQPQQQYPACTGGQHQQQYPACTGGQHQQQYPTSTGGQHQQQYTACTGGQHQQQYTASTGGQPEQHYNTSDEPEQHYTTSGKA